MRAAAEVVPVAVVIDRDVLACGQVADDLGLVLFADAFEMRDRLRARPHLAGGRQVRFDELVHPRLDPGQIVGGEGLVADEIVEEAVFDVRADGDLGAGEQLLHRLRHQMRGVVADEIERLGLVLARDDADRIAVGERRGEIAHLAAHLDGERGLGETGADRGGEVSARASGRSGPHAAVGQGDADLGFGGG